MRLRLPSIAALVAASALFGVGAGATLKERAAHSGSGTTASADPSPAAGAPVAAAPVAASLSDIKAGAPILVIDAATAPAASTAPPQ